MLRGDIALITNGILAGTSVVIIDEVRKGQTRTCYLNGTKLLLTAAVDGYAVVCTDGTPVILPVTNTGGTVQTAFQPMLVDKKSIVIIAGRNVKADDA